MNSVLIDTKMKSKIEYLNEWDKDVCSIKFKDLDDVFWFNSKEELQEFLNMQSVERFYDIKLRKGYFDYINDVGDTLRYYVESFRGNLKFIQDKII